MTTAEQGISIESLMDRIAQLESKSATSPAPKARKVRGNVPKRSRQSSDSGGTYGKAPVGVNASQTHDARKKALVARFGEAVIAHWREGQKIGLCMIASQGKIGNKLDKDLGRLDAAGVPLWSFVYMPGTAPDKGARLQDDPEIQRITQEQLGISLLDFIKGMRLEGYHYHRVGHCWQTRCDGTPARGRRNYRNAAKYARPDDQG